MKAPMEVRLAAQLRQLRKVNAELVEALELAVAVFELEGGHDGGPTLPMLRNAITLGKAVAGPWMAKDGPWNAKEGM